MTELFSKFNELATARAELEGLGIDPFGMPIERLRSPTEAIVNGRPMLLAGTNNYLGLTFNPAAVDAACSAVQQDGTGTTGSRMANGSYSGHIALERELADFYDCDQAIVFSTGYIANLGILSTLTGAGDVILLDADCHASIYDGCRMSGADIIRFRHNDVTDLEKRLRRLGERCANTLIVVEGIYSMLGDRAPLREIAELKRRYGACLLVDEAHSLGVLGAHGRGLSEQAEVEDEVDLIVGTFSKSLGGIGGYCVSRLPQLELLRYASRPYIFTASSSPAVIAATRQNLATLRSRPELRTNLWRNAEQFYHGLADLGYIIGPEVSPVIAVMLPTREQALALWSGLWERDVYVNLVFPPATPNNWYLFRCSVSAAHTAEQIDCILKAFAALQGIAKHAAS